MDASIPFNKISVELNYKNIVRDYFVYGISKADEGFRKSFFDFPISSMKARAVVYENDRSFYVLFDKAALSDEKIRTQLEEQDANARIRRIDELGLSALPKHLAAQLIFNTLNSCDGFDGAPVYNNITGGLYYFAYHKDRAGIAVTLHLKLTREMFLQMSVATFSKIGFRKLDERAMALPRYQYIPEYGRLVSVTNRNNVPQSECYIKRSFTPKKNTLDFIAFNRNKFDEYGISKVGILCRFLDDVKRYLSEYMPSIAIEALPECTEFVPVETGVTVDLGQLRNCELNIVVLVENEYAPDIERLCDILVDEYGVMLTFGDFRMDVNNLVIIHEPEYYISKGLLDPHQSAWPGVTQHVTAENFLRNANANNFSLLVKKTLQDLLIKKDIYDGKMSLVNMRFSSNYTFVIVGEKYDFGKNWRYYKMTLGQDGRLVFETFEHATILPLGSENQRIDAMYERYSMLPGYGYNIEALIYLNGDVNNAYVLSKTDARTLPLYDEMDMIIRSTNPANQFSKNLLHNELNKFLEHNESFKDNGQAQTILDILTHCRSDKISLKELLQCLSIGTKFMRQFNEYLIGSIGVPLTPTFKYKDNKAKYFGGFLGIKYYVQGGDLRYFVGYKDAGQIKTALTRSCVIRKVEPVSGCLAQEFIDMFLNFLAVDFIRESQYTVVPFPLKYLREYKSMEPALGDR